MRSVVWRTLFAGTLVVLGTLGSTPVSAADDPEAPPADPNRDARARNLFEAGRSAYQSGNYQDGLNYFERAYQESPRPGLLFNIGQAAYRLHVDDKALHAFKSYLDQIPQAPNRGEVEARIRELEQMNGTGTTPTYVSPEETARSGAAPLWAWPQSTTAADQPPPTSEPITKKWWFWTTLGAIVVGGTVTAVVLAT